MAPTFVDLFSGAGGLSKGLIDSGWQPLLAVDDWPDAIATYRLNLGDEAICADVKSLDARFFAGHVDGDVDWVVGGPPCQGWSTVGKRRWDDERNDLFTEFMRVVAILRPRNFLIENVLGLKDIGATADVRELFRGLGYHISIHVLRAADYGVPQLRRRVVFIGSADGQEFEAPASSNDKGDFVSVMEAIGDLPAVGPGQTRTEYDRPATNDYQRLLRRGSDEIQGHTVSNHPPELVRAISFIPDGGNRTAIPDEYQPRSGFHNSYSRLASWSPAVAVTSNLGKPSATRCIHPFQDRGLTAREGARLQSFPDRFHFVGGIVSQRLQVANAVPPLLGAALGRSLAEDLPLPASTVPVAV
jgi:DNA (cytosine-5)-methyltransferase 1